MTPPTPPAQPPVFRVVSYARVSTEEQGRGDYTSLDTQEDLIARHCAHQSDVTGRPWKVVASFRDELSGKDLHRPGLRALLAHIDQHGADAVAVYKLDRISRSLLDFLTLDARLQSGNVAVVSIRESFDTSTPIGRAMRSLLLVFAQLERETTLQRTMDAFEVRVREGRYAGGGVYYGYRRVAKGVLEVDHEQAAILRRIFHMYAVDGLSTQDIAGALNREGIHGRRGGAWSSAYVRRLLETPCYFGVQRHGERVGPWPFPVLVEPAIAERAAARIAASRRRKGPNTVRYEWHGLVRCGLCGSLCILHSSHGGAKDKIKRYHYLECTQPQRATERGVPKCRLPRAPGSWCSDWTDALLAAFRKAQPAPEPPPRPDTAQELLGIAAERRRYTVAFTAPGSMLGEGEYLAALANLDRREAALRPPPRADLGTAVTLADAWEGLTVAERNSILREYCDRAEMHPDHVEIVLRPTGWLNWPDRLPPIKRRW